MLEHYAKEFARELNDLKECKKSIDEALKILQKKCYKGISTAIDNSMDEDLYEAESRENEKKCFLYYLKCNETGFIKIGISTDVDRRVKALISASGLSIELLKKFEFESVWLARSAEKYLHFHYANFRKYGMNPSKQSTEWFSGSVYKSLPKTQEELDAFLWGVEEKERETAQLLGSLIHMNV